VAACRPRITPGITPISPLPARINAEQAFGQIEISVCEVSMFRKVGPVAAALFLFVSFLVSASLAQTSRSEVSASLTGDFSKETDGQGIAQIPSQSVGFLASYRFSLSSRSAVELNYAYTKNDQNYDFGGFGGNSIQTNVHEVTGA
jgi:hypothetical protein